MPTGGFQQIQRPDRIRVEIVEGDRCGAIMGRLGGRVYNQGRFYFLYRRVNSGTVANVLFMMMKTRNRCRQPPLVPTRVTLGTKKNRALIIVNPVDFEAMVIEVEANL